MSRAKNRRSHRPKVHHIVFGAPTHPDCPLCKLDDAAADVVMSHAPHPPECPCRFCKPTTSMYVLAPLQPWEDEIIDIAVGQEDGSLKITASYRVERDRSITWLTPDGRPPKDFIHAS
jgi:hypothetical protein